MDPTGTILRPTRWSYSSISEYKDCPLQYKLDYIDGLSYQEGTSASRGSRLHKNAEDYIKCPPWDIVQLEKDMLPLGPELERMKQNGWLSEETWLADRNWNPVDSDEAAYIKSIVDLHHLEGDILEIIDLKSGKRYPEHEEQLQLYAMIGIKRYPEAKRVDVKAWYIDEGGTFGFQASYLPQMFDHYAATWNELAERMFKDTEFVPTPSINACRFCPFKRSKGGPCEEGDKWSGRSR